MSEMRIPQSISRIIGNRPYRLDDIGRSDSQVICFEDMVLKIEKVGENAGQESTMLKWLQEKLPVPRILQVEEEGFQYLLMSRMAGEMACSPRYLENQRQLVKGLAQGLKLLWSVDISDCPCRSGLDELLKRARIQVEQGLVDMENVQPDTFGENGFKDPMELLIWLEENRPQEDFVLSHGDYCLPNVFLKEGQISGFIDLGRSGVSDRYMDIALCWRSLLNNLRGEYGGKAYQIDHPELLFEELGMEPDWEKIRYYILLDELF